MYAVSIRRLIALHSGFRLSPIDLFHLHLFPKPSVLTPVLGGVMLLIGFGIILATLYQNSFAAPIVEDRTKEGQVVLDTGLYGLVRHPMYLGDSSRILSAWPFGSKAV